LTSVTVPRSMRELASGAFDDCHALSLIAFENGSAIVSIGGMSRTNLRSVHFPVGEPMDFLETSTGSEIHSNETAAILEIHRSP
jgi:hypothetical protein